MITFKLKILVVADPMPFFTPLLIGISDQRPADKPKVAAIRKIIKAFHQLLINQVRPGTASIMIRKLLHQLKKPSPVAKKMMRYKKDSRSALGWISIDLEQRFLLNIPSSWRYRLIISLPVIVCLFYRYRNLKFRILLIIYHWTSLLLGYQTSHKRMSRSKNTNALDDTVRIELRSDFRHDTEVHVRGHIVRPFRI